MAYVLRPVLSGFFAIALLSLAVLSTAGCGHPVAIPASPSMPMTIQGSVYGGQQPVTGATIQLYAAGVPPSGGGYGVGATALITGTLPTTDSNGNFTITGRYPSPLSTPSYFYIVSTGGSPGKGNPANPNIVLMAAISNCTPTTTLSPSLFININEVTTVAAVSVLQPFLSAPTGTAGAPVLIGAPAAASNDLRNAFAMASSLANISTGTVVTSTSSNGQRINTLADILVYCVNSYSPSTNCSNLSTAATPSGAIPAVDTMRAAWYIAQNPTSRISTLFAMVPPNPPFEALSTAPASFAVSLPPTAEVACFVLLGGSTIINTGATVVSGGDVGLYPGTSVTGFSFSTAPGPGTITLPALQHINDAIAEDAKTGLAAAYNYAAGLTGAAAMTADMSNLTFVPGVYNNSTTLALSAGQVTLDAQNNSNAVFIFQIGSTLVTAAGTQVILVNGAQAKNVFWQVGSSATLGANSTLEGTIMANTTITLGTNVKLHGRALAMTGAVNLDTDTVTAP